MTLDEVKFDTIAPMNEPTADWWKYGGGQEGCHMDALQQNRVIKYLGKNLKRSGLPIGIVASEDNSESQMLKSLGKYDADGKDGITILASHTYYADNPARLKALAASLNKPLWLSEYGDGDATGMKMARRIRDDITQTGAKAWIYWQFVDNVGGWGLLKNPLNGKGDTKYQINNKFYTLWQFSHFIRPGSQIISVDDTNSMAAYDPTNHSLFIVCLNNTANAFNVTYDLRAFERVGTEVNRWRTSLTERALALGKDVIANQQYTTTVPPQSVTTYLIKNAYARQHLSCKQIQDNTFGATGNVYNVALNFRDTSCLNK